MLLTHLWLLHIYLKLFFTSNVLSVFTVYRENYNGRNVRFVYQYETEPNENTASFNEQKIYSIRDVETLRMLAEDDYDDLSNQNGTFSELAANNITADDLLASSESWEQVELYQMYLDGLSSIDMTNQIFIYCQSPWFGNACIFRVEEKLIYQSFETMLQNWLEENSDRRNKIPACYVHLQCKPSSRCLDWREICDLKVDCIDGSDEMHCWMLEINECAEDEFRCRNGQCIPQEFFDDHKRMPDCLDASDERVTSALSLCWYYPFPFCSAMQCQQLLTNHICGEGFCSVPGNMECVLGSNSYSPGNKCWEILTCLLRSHWARSNSTFRNFCNENNLTQLKQKHCPPWIQFPPIAVLFDHVRFIFTNETRNYVPDISFSPDYICFDIERCPNILFKIVHFGNLTCVHYTSFHLKTVSTYEELIDDLKNRFLECKRIFYEGKHCSHKNMYQCQNSHKCVSKYRLMDGVQDCLFNDDENMTLGELVRYSLPPKRQFLTLSTVSASHIRAYQEHQLGFEEICDGIDHFLPTTIDGMNETDETNCYDWPCNTKYTRCNKQWSCDNGADEINCGLSDCPRDHHPCIFFNLTTKISCLPVDRIGNGIIECIGGFDEPNYQRRPNKTDSIFRCFTCRETEACLNYIDICNKKADCPLNDDEIFCRYNRIRIDTYPYYSWASTQVEGHIEAQLYPDFNRLKRFRLGQVRSHIFPTIFNLSGSNVTKLSGQLPISFVKPRELNDTIDATCYDGIPVYFRLKNQTNGSICLCSPSTYGDQCQYQSQHVSLTIKINPLWKWTNIFVFVITLIDENYNIESYELIEYLYTSQFIRRYHRDLVYATQPTNISRNYSIRIDAFDKVSGQYQASWIYPIRFRFLPIYRLPVLLFMHNLIMTRSSHCSPSCIHGECLYYLNAKQTSFCRCDAGWSGGRCDKSIQCQCALGAYCYSKSICICPMNRYGPRCFLKAQPLPTKHCQNGGSEIFLDRYYQTRSISKIICQCRSEFYGDRCQNRYTLLHIQFHSTVSVPLYVWIHWIQVVSTTGKTWSRLNKIPINQNALLLYIPNSFQLAFAQISTNYYLIFSRPNNVVPAKIETQIHASHRCLSIDEIFNQTIVNLHPLKRIKYYQYPCRKNSALVCFYDNRQLCLCETNDFTNCLKHNHRLNFDCQEKDACMNGGRCMTKNYEFQQYWGECLCQGCYFGSKCQFSTKDTHLSLGLILGHHLKAHLSVAEQSKIIKATIAFVTTMLVVGYLNNIASLWAFHSPTTLDVDGGRYLLGAAITSLVLITLLVIKFWLYIVWQLGFITDRSIIQRQCYMMDFSLRLFVSSIDWFFALASIERTFTVVRRIRFDKMKGQKITKRIILVVFLVTILTYLHDPLHRKVVKDEREERTWCVTDFSRTLDWYDRSITMIHFFIPFIINLVTMMIIIIWVIHQQWRLSRCTPLKKMIKIQFQIHRHRLLSAFFLLIINLCRIFLTLFAPCMKTARDPWRYIVGYFFSFIPATLTGLIFVLPSDLHRKEMIRSIKNCCKD